MNKLANLGFQVCNQSTIIRMNLNHESNFINFNQSGENVTKKTDIDSQLQLDLWLQAKHDVSHCPQPT